MTLQLTDREDQTLLVALELLRTTVADRVAENPVKKINEYEILDRKHTLMHIIQLMARITGKPHATFMNPQPSQTTTPNAA